MSFQPGDPVRFRNDPSRVGMLTSQQRVQHGATYWRVHFPDRHEYVPENQLESAEAPPDPLDLLIEGRLAQSRALRRVLTHAKLSGRLADVLYSLDATKTDFYAYQFKPILKLLNSVSQGILIADEVGLGKTIEAGLIWTELRSRFEFRRLFVLCPSVLREKWREELIRRFGVKAEICDATETLDRLREAASEDLSSRFAIIGSMPGLRPRKGWNEETPTGSSPQANRLAAFLDAKAQDRPLIDLLVIDEAHHLRNFETATSQLGHLLRSVSDYVVLLSATPVHLGSQDLFQLVRLIDEDTYASQGEFDEILRANGPLIQARDRVLAGKMGRAQFIELVQRARRDPVLRDSRQLSELAGSPPTDDELADPSSRAAIAHGLDQINLLSQVVTRTRKRDVHERRVVRQPVPEAVALSRPEREFYESVTEIVRDFCRKRNAHEGFLLTTPQRQMASSIPAAYRHWQNKLLGRSTGRLISDLEDADEEALGVNGETNQKDEEEGVLVRTLVDRVTQFGTCAELRRVDSKYARLREQIRQHLSIVPNAKFVLFSSFRATLSYLEERLREDHTDTLMLHGGVTDKDEVISAFQDHSGPLVLLSSEVGSEGVDLQSARVLINYDLPWNPMRVEQRIGRLDRIGQSAERISIWNLFCEDTIDARIYRRLYDRLKIFENALGGLEEVLGDEIRRLTSDLMADRLTPQQEVQRIDQTALALENTRQTEERLEDEASNLLALGDYLLRQVQSARELGRHITDQDLRNYVLDFVGERYPDASIQQVDSDGLTFDIRLPIPAKHELEQFIRRQRLEGVTRLVLSGSDPVRCRFQSMVVSTHWRGPEVVSQFHPLVRMASEHLKKAEGRLQLAIAARVSAGKLTRRVGPGVYTFSVERWSVSGIQDLEKLAYEAARIDTGESLHEDDAERLVATAAIHGADWLEAKAFVERDARCIVAAERCLHQLRERYRSYVHAREIQNHDRVDVHRQSLRRQLQGQRVRLEATMREHEKKGRKGLTAATHAKIERLEERVARRELEMAEANFLKTESRLFLVGVIEVTE